MFFIKTFQYTFDYTRNQLIDIVDNYVFNEQKNEKEIFKLLIQGYTCEQISKIVSSSPSTIKRRRAQLFYKLDKFLQERGEINLNKIKTNDARNPVRYSVYVLIFPNHKMYVGQTQNVKQRWSNGNGYRDNKRMYKDIVRYGWNSILKNIVYTDLSYTQSIYKEKELTLLYKTYIPKLGYNRIIGNGDKR